MRTIIPGSVSPAYLKAFRDTQVEFFKSITMDEDKAKRIREENPLNGVTSTKLKRVN